MNNGSLVLEDVSLEQKFWRHAEMVKSLPPTTPDNMLIAYSYYKQATMGDVELERPTESSQIIETFKYDSWKRLKGMTREDAMHHYIQTIKRIKTGG